MHWVSLMLTIMYMCGVGGKKHKKMIKLINIDTLAAISYVIPKIFHLACSKYLEVSMNNSTSMISPQVGFYVGLLLW